MEEVKVRTRLVLDITSQRVLVPGPVASPIELACVQLRKTLELIAFGSLIANKAKYATAHANFAEHWSAKRLLKNLSKMHPGFYPRPITFGPAESPGIHNFVDIDKPFLSRDDFEFLYDAASRALHIRNPFRTDSPVIEFRLSISEWIGRIQQLLAIHLLRFIDSPDLWVVTMSSPEDARVHVTLASPQKG